MKLYIAYYQDHDGIQDFMFYLCPNPDNAKVMFCMNYPQYRADFVGVEEVPLTEQAIELLRSNDDTEPNE